MKKNPTLKNYYEEYLEVCSIISPQVEMPALVKLVKQNQALSNSNIPFGTCLIDYSKRKYLYMSDHSKEILGHPKDKYLDEGIDFQNRIRLSDDSAIFYNLVFRDIMEYWKLIPHKEIAQYRVSFNYRILRSDGKIAQCLQHSTYLEPLAGLPVLNLLTFSDISDFKTDDSTVLTISRLVDGAGYAKVFSRSYWPQSKSILSARELEVLLLSYEGLSNKMIAEKLYISIQTVKNHKANMMEKTSARNIVELINVGQKNKWI